MVDEKAKEVEVGPMTFDEPKVRNFTCKKGGHEFSTKDNNGKRGHSLTFYDADGKEIASTGSYCPICLCDWIRENCEVEESE